MPSCPTNPPSSLDEAVQNGYRFAPLVKYHPDEMYYMESPDAWFADSQEFPAPGNGLSKPFRTKFDGDISLNDAAKLAENAGTAFDASGKSTATVYFTVQEYADDYWLYNYQLFFGWNGCSSQAYATQDGQYLSYQMCPAGVHECDLEIVSVLVCKSDLISGPRRVGYNQHAWSEIRSCDDGDRGCQLNGTHPIAYVALGGHALYPENNAPFHVYYHAPNLPVWVGDRTAEGGKTWEPTQENVKWLPIIDGLPEDASWEWARFIGNWGRIFADVPETTIQCFSDDDSSGFVECGADKAGMLQIIKAGAALTNESKPAQDQFLSGPLYRSPTYQILGNKEPPVFQQIASGVLQCPKDVASGEASVSTQELLPPLDQPAENAPAVSVVPVVNDTTLAAPAGAGMDQAVSVTTPTVTGTNGAPSIIVSAFFTTVFTTLFVY